MLDTLPRAHDINRHAPRITTVKVKPDQIRIIIGPWQDIKASSSKRLRRRRQGRRHGVDRELGFRGRQARVAIIEASPRSPRSVASTTRREALGRLRRVRRILPNNEALLHVSEIAHERIESPGDVLKEGEEIDVKVISVERDGKVA